MELTVKLTGLYIYRQDRESISGHGKQKWKTICRKGEQMNNDWTIVSHIHLDKFGNPFVGVAEREVDV